MRSGFFLSRAQWKRGWPGNVEPSWALGHSVNINASSLCRWRQRPVVHWFSQMCIQNLGLFSLITCPPPP